MQVDKQTYESPPDKPARSARPRLKKKKLSIEIKSPTDQILKQ